MKQYSRREFLMYIAASSAEAVLFYIGYMFVNQLIGGSASHILFFIISALCGLLVNLLPYNNADKRKQSLTFSIVGLLLASLETAISVMADFNLYSLPILFAILVLLYYRANMRYLSSVLYIYSIGSFNRGIAFLFLLNLAAAYFTDIFSNISSELVRYAMLYILMGLYMLTEIKHFKYISKNENNKKSAFDIIAIVGMIALTVIMSVPKIFAIFIKPFAFAFGFVYDLIVKLLVYASYPMGIGLNYLYSLVHMPEEGNIYHKIFKEVDPLTNRFDKAIVDETNPTVVNIIEIIGKTLTFLVLLGICAYLLYLLFRFIDRYNRSKSVEDFQEEKEFILGKRKSKGSGLIKRLGGTVKRVAGEIAFTLTADNADKLRNEYKNFIKKLHNKKIIEHYNYTALDILDITALQVPEQETALERITSMYEEVRYGVKYPQDDELKAFRKSLEELSKAILQSQ
ncbi:MAG: hypothetical protein K0R84_347 [Clostridia bacterium]|jgi:hypothetical protein|nr:hypothetical protein [Clostridia bacterium]